MNKSKVHAMWDANQWHEAKQIYFYPIKHENYKATYNSIQLSEMKSLKHLLKMQELNVCLQFIYAELCRF